jgi:hypothetical protein
MRYQKVSSKKMMFQIQNAKKEGRSRKTDLAGAPRINDLLLVYATGYPLI